MGDYMRNTESALVSIITVCFNAVKTIETTIKSVVNQSYKNIEYIIIDGGSTDGTLGIIEAYRKYISVVVSEQDKGIYDAMNKGISLAKGDYIGIINADDWYEQDAVEKVVRISRDIPANAEVISGRIRFMEGDQSFLVSQKEMEQIWMEMPISHPATFIRKSVYEKYGTYNTHYQIAADYELIFRLYINHVNFYFCNDILANFRVGGISSARKDILLREDVEVLNQYKKYAPNQIKVEDGIKRKDSIRLFYKAGRDILCEILGITSKYQKILVFGCGYWGREMIKQMDRWSITVEAVVDNNSDLWGTKISEHIVSAPVILQKQLCPKIVIAIQGQTSAIEGQILSLNQEASYINLESLLKRIYDICGGDRK